MKVTRVSYSHKPAVGFFEQDSTIWRVNREMILLAAGGRALLMQVAHPKVAAGVAQHSDFQKDPFARLHRTMAAMWSIVFVEVPQARAALEGIGKVHARVRGVVDPDEGAFAGTSYNANDQELLLWVHATLIDSALVGYEQFVAPMTRTQKTAYYDDSKRLATLFGIDEKLIPNNLNDFEKYMHQMMAGDEITIDSTARSVSQDILYARPWIFKLAGPLFRLVTAGLLPARLREGYGLNWSARRAKLLARFSKMVRFLLPLVPGVIRIVPNARAAEKVRRVTLH